MDSLKSRSAPKRTLESASVDERQMNPFSCHQAASGGESLMPCLNIIRPTKTTSEVFAKVQLRQSRLECFRLLLKILATAVEEERQTVLLLIRMHACAVEPKSSGSTQKDFGGNSEKDTFMSNYCEIGPDRSCHSHYVTI